MGIKTYKIPHSNPKPKVEEMGATQKGTINLAANY